MEKTSSEILTEAARYLENEGKWGKGAFFQFPTPESSNKGCVMCAHGAIAYCGNPKIKNSVDAGKSPGTVREHGYNSKNVLSAHDYAAGVGLSYNYNDFVAQTKEQIIDKLREAAALALINETETRPLRGLINIPQ